METSILKSVKKVCGVSETDDSFDEDILMFTNNAFSTLQQLGIGPAVGFQIEDADPTWSDFIDTDNDPRYNAVKSYVTQSVRLRFDPPPTSFHLEALKEQIKEAEWRLNVLREGDTWVDPTPPVPVIVDPFY